VLALAQFGENAGLLALLLEAPDGALDRLVFLDSDACHEPGLPLAAEAAGDTISEKAIPVKVASELP
jgi:hypothetical protein